MEWSSGIITGKAFKPTFRNNSDVYCQNLGADVPKRKRTLTVDNQTRLNQLMTNADTDTDEDDELSDQIQTLMDRKDNLDAGYAYIAANLNGLRGHFNVTPTQALAAIQQGIAAVDGQIKTLQALLVKRQNFASRLITKRKKSGQAGDGNCYVSFVNVGMGDCTIVTTPKGVLIMIDCGSDSLSDVILDPDWDPLVGPTAETYIRNNVKAPTFLNGGKQIDLLFLSHPDADHHDKLETILSPLGVTASMCYYGGADAITAYTSSAYIKRIAGTTDTSLRKVVLCEDPTLDTKGKIVLNKTINGKTLPSAGKPGQIGSEFIDPATGAMVIYYESDKTSDFRISVIAGNVTGVWKGGKFVTSDKEIKTASEMKDEGTPPNKRSLIVLIECFKEKIVVCGDATAVTERFAGDYFSDQLEQIQYLRTGHHGSPTSSSNFFISAVEKNLKMAVASTGGKTTVVHRLPKQKIIGLYVPVTADGSDDHSIYAFERDDTIAQLYFPDLTDQVYATGSNDTVPITIM